jgi:hypothetical protein
MALKSNGPARTCWSAFAGKSRAFTWDSTIADKRKAGVGDTIDGALAIGGLSLDEIKQIMYIRSILELVGD